MPLALYPSLFNANATAQKFGIPLLIDPVRSDYNMLIISKKETVHILEDIVSVDESQKRSGKRDCEADEGG